MSENPTDRLDGYSPPELGSTDPAADQSILDAIAALRSSGHTDAADGFVNTLTGIGDFTRDKTLGGKQGGPDFVPTLMDGTACSHRWRGHALGRRIIERVPSEMTREGFDLTIQPSPEQRKMDGFARLGARRRARRDALAQMDPRQAKQQAGAPPQPGFTPRAPSVVPERDDEGQAVIEEVAQEWKRLKADHAFWLALCYRRCYGGAAILIGVDDGAPDLLTPLDWDKVKRITHLTVFRGGWDGEVLGWSYFSDMSRENYGAVESYMLRNLGVPISSPLPPAPGGASPGLSAVQALQSGSSLTFTFAHRSRLLIFSETPPSNSAAVQMRGWGDSIFTQVNEVLSQYGQSWNGLAALMQDWALGTITIEGLAAALARNGSDGKAAQNSLMTRALMLQMSMSLTRTRMLDSKEKYERHVVPLSGVAEVFGQFSEQLAAASGMPVSLLVGAVKGGLGDAGNSDMRNFYDDVKHWQKIGLQPQTEQLCEGIMRAKEGPTGGVIPDRWAVSFRPLYQLTAKEEAERRKANADADCAYVNANVLSAEEVAGSRFGGSQYGNDITLDMEGREQVAADLEDQAAEQERLAAEAAKNPPPPAEPGEPKPPAAA